MVGNTQLSSLQMRREMEINEVIAADLPDEAVQATEGGAVWQKLAQEVMDTIRQQHELTWSAPDEDLASGEHFAKKVEVTCP